MKLSEFLKDWRILLYIFLIIASIWILLPKGNMNYVFVTDVVEGSLADKIGISIGTKIYSIDYCPTPNLKAFYECLDRVKGKDRVLISTDRGMFYVNLSKGDLGITVSEPSKYPVKFGIDIVGGVRVVLEPEDPNVPLELLEEAKDILEKRLNFFGLKEVNIRTVVDFSGNKYIVIELPKGYESLVGKIRQQGKFEARIMNRTIFTGEDVIDVCRNPECSRIEPVYGGYRFMFQITITREAAQRLYEAVKDLPVEGEYLNATLDFYLDGKFVTSLRIAREFKNQIITTPFIEGVRRSKEDAIEEMKKLQMVLTSGRLPIKLKISRIDHVSPTIGTIYLKEFVFAGLLALLAVAGVIYARYRNWKVSALISINMVVETIATLAVATLIGWTMDIPSLAGLVIAIGTGVDDQVVITDELLYEGKDEVEKRLKITERIKRAFFIVISSYLAFGAAMIPLFYAGAGVLKGFAVTTLIGITIGALITRPAFARILEKIL